MNLLKKTENERLRNIDLLAEQPFFKQQSIIKENQAFRGYEMSYKVEIVEKKYLIVQLEVSKLSIKDLLSNPLHETRGFRYQITVKVLLKKIQAS